jgi:hypothetical protein
MVTEAILTTRIAVRGRFVIKKPIGVLCAPSPRVTWAHVIELVRRAGAVMLGIDCALASASDLAGLGTPLWLLLAYRASVFLVLYAQSP